VERLLSITGGGRIQVNVKNREPWVGRLDVMFTIDSNLEINLPDASGAINTRMIFNRTANSVLGHEDFGLGQRIIDHELPGVMRKVLDYVDKIYDPWPVNARADASRQRSVALSQPLSAWAETVGLLLGKEYNCAVDSVYDSYTGWCAMEGVPQVKRMDKPRFGVALAGFVDGLEKRRTGPRDARVMTYFGVGLIE
jgi:putative DNA primase/helicase